jgi:hypothetical protein
LGGQVRSRRASQAAKGSGAFGSGARSRLAVTADKRTDRISVRGGKRSFTLGSQIDKTNAGHPMLTVVQLVLLVLASVGHQAETATTGSDTKCQPTPYGLHNSTIHDTWTANRGYAEKIESKVDYPKHIYEYARYYSGMYGIDCKKSVFSEWINPVLGGDPPGIYFRPLTQFPRIPNGGCESVHIKYDVASDKIFFIGCGGPPY